MDHTCFDAAHLASYAMGATAAIVAFVPFGIAINAGLRRTRWKDAEWVKFAEGFLSAWPRRDAQAPAFPAPGAVNPNETPDAKAARSTVRP